MTSSTIRKVGVYLVSYLLFVGLYASAQHLLFERAVDSYFKDETGQHRDDFEERTPFLRIVVDTDVSDEARRLAAGGMLEEYSPVDIVAGETYVVYSAPFILPGVRCERIYGVDSRVRRSEISPPAMLWLSFCPVWVLAMLVPLLAYLAFLLGRCSAAPKVLPTKCEPEGSAPQMSLTGQPSKIAK